MMRAIDAALGRRATVYVACAASLALGLFFIFIWTPLPWGWKGIDGYDAISVDLAQGAPFPTVHLVWGYAYFLAFFYWLFGNHPAVGLSAQAIFNASIPLMLYHIVRREMSERIAVMAAVLVGFLSFNTVYASTQASDAMCTVLVVATVLCLQQGERLQRIFYFVLAGLLASAAYQFRPNLVLLPPFMAAGYLLLRTRVPGSLMRMVVFLTIFAVGAVPWIVRNYRFTGLFIPASTHGGVQLWFGTLQTGPYRESWLYNPRAAFEFPPVDYTSIDELPLVITGETFDCYGQRPQQADLVYWTNRDRAPQRVQATVGKNGDVTALVPAQPSPTAVDYYFETPPHPHGRQRTIVVSRDHLGDLDVDGHALDVFDIVRMLRHLAWQEPLDPGLRDFDHDGRVTEADLRHAAALIVDDQSAPASVADPVSRISFDDTEGRIQFVDGSTLTVDRRWSGKITDLRLGTPIVDSKVSLLMNRSRPLAALRDSGDAEGSRKAERCQTVISVAANRVPYRRLPHELRRFTALASDNIRHDPWAYLVASAGRAVRVFIIAGSEDKRTAYQFSGASAVYAIGRIVSLSFFALLIAGVWLARARGFRLFLLLAPIVYVPLTICFMLINARYSMTMQPFVFAFVAVSIVTALDALATRARSTAVQSH
jgi:Dolichyl-phosphate-mannose-protein mannosyltransferase